MKRGDPYPCARLDDLDIRFRIVVEAVRGLRAQGVAWTADAIERLLSAWTEADLVTLLKVLERHTMDRAGVQRFATMRDALTALRG